MVLMVGLRSFYWFSTIFQANQDALKAFLGFGIEIIVGVHNDKLRAIYFKYSLKYYLTLFCFSLIILKGVIFSSNTIYVLVVDDHLLLIRLPFNKCMLDRLVSNCNHHNMWPLHHLISCVACIIDFSLALLVFEWP